jgi:nucleoside-diphosphate-sugar epimerase
MTRPTSRRSGVQRGCPDPPRVVAVTGAAGVLGSLVVSHLGSEPGGPAVVAIDSTATVAPGTVNVADSTLGTGATGTPTAWRTADVRDPGFARALDGVDVVVHTAWDQRPEVTAAERRRLNIDGTARVLDAAAGAGAARLVVVSSAMVYGALPDNPELLTEDMPLRAPYDDSIVGDYVEVERMVAEHCRRCPDMRVVVLRPVIVTGPGCDTVLTRHFEAPRLLTVRGESPNWQFVHIADLAAACALAAVADVDGPLNVSPPGVITHADVERITRMRRIELPASLVFGAAERLHRAGVTGGPSAELTYIAYPWDVDASRLLAAGWRPEHDHESALRVQVGIARDQAMLAARRLGREDATRAAAGATIAALGTAAIVRRARRRRG